MPSNLKSPLNDLYFLLFEELEQRFALLFGQARHLHLVSKYLVFQGHAGTSSAPISILDSAKSVETFIKESRAGLAEQMDKLLSISSDQLGAVLESRHKYLIELAKQASHVKILQRALAAELDSITPEYSRPTVFHGLEQFDIIRATSDLAYSYCTAIHRQGKSAGIFDRQLEIQRNNIVISYEPIMSPRQKSYSTQDQLHINARLPFWYAYMPRYQPNIAHEVAHPFIREAERYSRRDHVSLNMYRKAMVENVAALGVLTREAFKFDLSIVFENFEQSVLEECLADLLALFASGPSYIMTLAVSTIGSTALSAPQKLSVPMAVRLDALLTAARRMYGDFDDKWDFVSATVRADLDLYRNWCKEEAPSKLRYQELMLEIVGEFFERMHELWGLGERQDEQPPLDPACGQKIRDYLGTIADLAEYRDTDLTVPVDSMEDYFEKPSFRDAPSAVWLTYFANLDMAKKPRHARTPYIPEGRIFHAWHRITEPVDGGPESCAGARSPDISLEFGQWWEMTFLEVVWTNAQGESAERFDGLFDKLTAALEETDQGSGDRFAQAYHTFGLFDFMTLRATYEAKRQQDTWPPVDDIGAAYFPRRHIMNEIVSLSGSGYEYSKSAAATLAEMSMFAVTQLKIKNEECPFQALIKVLDNADDACEIVGIFQSLGWEDFVLVWRLNRLSELGSLARHLSRDGIRSRMVRSITQVALSGNRKGDERDAEPLSMLTQIRIHPGKRLEDVEVCLERSELDRGLGRYDVQAKTKLHSESELRDMLEKLEELAADGLVVETESSFLVQPPPKSGEPS